MQAGRAALRLFQLHQQEGHALRSMREELPVESPEHVAAPRDPWTGAARAGDPPAGGAGRSCC